MQKLQPFNLGSIEQLVYACTCMYTCVNGCISIAVYVFVSFQPSFTPPHRSLPSLLSSPCPSPLLPTPPHSSSPLPLPPHQVTGSNPQLGHLVLCQCNGQWGDVLGHQVRAVDLTEDRELINQFEAVAPVPFIVIVKELLNERKTLNQFGLGQQLQSMTENTSKPFLYSGTSYKGHSE